MSKEKFLIVGSGGREGAFASNLSKDTEVHAIIGHENPTIIEHVNNSGGNYIVSNPNDPLKVAEYATKNNIDYAFVSADVALASGVIDALLEFNIKAVGGTKEATRIEWDKIYSIDLVQKVCPEFTPFYKVIERIEDIDSAIKEFEEQGFQVVIKPQGLTGGKGVKVMPEHLSSYQDATQYAKELLEEKPNEKVLLVEKLEGIEFTIMGLTDGETLVSSPASYDYPFRFKNDSGAGTGGMGCFINSEKKLPFMTDQHLADCEYVMQSVIDEMRERNLFFNGVLNGGFFITKKGIKFMEFNGRFGDPEGLNILSILKSPFSQLIKDLWHKTLSSEKVDFIEKASVIKYLVAKEYPNVSEEVISFSVDRASIEKMGLSLFFASAVHDKENGRFNTLKTSRVVALGAVEDTIPEASLKINEAIENHIQGNLDYRDDIGSQEDLNKIFEKISKF